MVDPAQRAACPVRQELLWAECYASSNPSLQSSKAALNQLHPEGILNKNKCILKMLYVKYINITDIVFFKWSIIIEILNKNLQL